MMNLRHKAVCLLESLDKVCNKNGTVYLLTGIENQALCLIMLY